MNATGVLDQKLRRMFEMLDVDGDGRLIQEDVLTLANRLAAAFGSADESAKITWLRHTLAELWTKDLSTMAAEPSGPLDCREYIAGVRKAVSNNREGFLQRLTAMVAAWMDIADTDGNGVVDESEFVTMYSKTFGYTSEDLKVAFAKLDLDGNGALDREEIRQAAEEFCTSEDPQAPGNWLFGPL